MRNRGVALKRLTSFADNLGESAPGVTLAEAFGHHRVLIENHGGVLRYCPTEMVIKASYGSMVVSGKCLQLAVMTKHQLVITGEICQITLRSI